MTRDDTCPTCTGAGGGRDEDGWHVCPTCRGAGWTEHEEDGEMQSVLEINEQILASLVSSARALRSNDGLSDEELRRRFNHFSTPLAYRELRLYHERDEQDEQNEQDNRASAR